MIVVSNLSIKRLSDNLHHVKWNGEWTLFGATTISKAESHLAKLQKGLVQFEPLTASEHKPAFKPGFCNGATSKNRLHRTI